MVVEYAARNGASSSSCGHSFHVGTGVGTLPQVSVSSRGL